MKVFERTLNLVAAICSIVSLVAATGLQWVEWSWWWVAIPVGLVSAIMMFVLEYKRGRDWKTRHSGEPTILIITGKKCKDTANAIENSEKLKIEPYIKFVTVPVPDENLRQILLGDRGLVKAQGIILMPDFNLRDHEQDYRAFKSCVGSQPVPVTRYYPPGNLPDGFDSEFTPMRFNTPDDVAMYGAEHLLSRAVDRGRWLFCDFRISKRVTVALLVLFSIGVALAYRTFAELKLHRQLILLQGTEQQAFAEMLTQFRNAEVNTDLSQLQRQQLTGLLFNWASLEIKHLDQLPGANGDKRGYIYGVAQRDNGLKLTPVAHVGTEGYDLDINNSIAGCAFTHKVAVYWAGRNDKTSQIRAWRLTGEETGKYYDEEKRLSLDGSYCQYQHEKDNEPRGQILCIPIGVDQSATSVPGVVCLEGTKSGMKLDASWLRNFLISQSFVLGVLDLRRLVATPEHPDVTSSPKAPKPRPQPPQH